MVNEKDLETYYSAIKEVYSRALDDVSFFLDKALRECNEEEISRIYTASRTSKRVKVYESILRKARRDNVESIESLPDSIEDILGIRISTPNKVQARRLYDWFQSTKDKWFCPTISGPKFVPYTMEDRNKYSLRTGYQAYHITFTVDRGYIPFTTNRKWPCEIQIMSQVWEFWANYSRRYFYATSMPNIAQLLPYNTAISKILDSADDLMVATAELLLSAEHQPTEAGDNGADANEAPEISGITPAEVRDWFQTNIATVFHKKAKVPNKFFLAKIADELNIYGVGLQQLTEILSDKNIKLKYRQLLKFNNVPFLPMYQQILCMILLSQKRDIHAALNRVNSELRLTGVKLEVPPGFENK